jgi:hypothetical protein
VHPDLSTNNESGNPRLLQIAGGSLKYVFGRMNAALLEADVYSNVAGKNHPISKGG